MIDPRKAGAAGAIILALASVPHFEGLRQRAYADPVGIPTICFGHTGREVKLGQVFTLDTCKELLASDLLVANAVVDSCVTYKLEDYQRAALISFAYNVGGGAKGIKDGLCTLKSGNQSSIVRNFNAGNIAEACAGLDAWVMARGIKLPGLVKRRAEERSMCEGKLTLHS